MAVRKDGSVIAVGSDAQVGPFVVRLIGDNSAVGPGIVGFAKTDVSLLESDRRAIVRVRRRGGSDGNVSVRYRTMADSEATPGQDFRATSGTLHWADGDTSEREIFLQIVQDDGPAEGFESFHVTLDSAQGGAGIGARLATVNIQPDGSPAGQVFLTGAPSITEEAGVARFLLARDYYSSGRICVTLKPKSGTARAGEDFEADASTVCWEDQDTEEKFVEIDIIDDSVQEDVETFTVELSNPTGGALIGWHGSVTVPIAASDQSATPPPPPPPPAGGGGSAGLVELLALLGGLLVSSRRRLALLRTLAPFLAGALLAGPAWSAVGVRVASRSITTPIDVYRSGDGWRRAGQRPRAD